MKKTFTLLPLVLALAACATSPEKVRPFDMGGAYSTFPCSSVGETLRAEKVTLAGLEDSQRAARKGDVLGVIVVGVPMSSLAGKDVEAELSLSKGKVQALELRNLECGGGRNG